MDAKGEGGRNGRWRSIERPEYQAIRDLLRQALADRGIGQRELSRKLDKQFVYINRILTKRRTLELGEFLEICEEIGVDPAEIFTTAIRNAKTSEQPPPS